MRGEQLFGIAKKKYQLPSSVGLLSDLLRTQTVYSNRMNITGRDLIKLAILRNFKKTVHHVC